MPGSQALGIKRNLHCNLKIAPSWRDCLDEGGPKDKAVKDGKPLPGAVGPKNYPSYNEVTWVLSTQPMWTNPSVWSGCELSLHYAGKSESPSLTFLVVRKQQRWTFWRLPQVFYRQKTAGLHLWEWLLRLLQWTATWLIRPFKSMPAMTCILASLCCLAVVNYPDPRKWAEFEGASCPL